MAMGQVTDFAWILVHTPSTKLLDQTVNLSIIMVVFVLIGSPHFSGVIPVAMGRINLTSVQ